ncbi:MAG: pyridoxal 5'-phosphate synthase glutaminase subunit PdxT [Acidimicrobiia bacterium]
MRSPLRVGVLALQGAFAAHEQAVAELGHQSRQVRLPRDLDGIDALIMPGGESTTMSMLLESSGLLDEIHRLIGGGLPVLGTCAGMILLASEVLDGRSDQRSLGAIDISVRRNGYGRQIDSFETDLVIDGFDPAFHAVFIRAPVVERIGAGVAILAAVDGRPVLCASTTVMVASFHPELSGDSRIHQLFFERMIQHGAIAPGETNSPGAR